MGTFLLRVKHSNKDKDYEVLQIVDFANKNDFPLPHHRFGEFVTLTSCDNTPKHDGFIFSLDTTRLSSFITAVFALL